MIDGLRVFLSNAMVGEARKERDVALQALDIRGEYSFRTGEVFDRLQEWGASPMKYMKRGRLEVVAGCLRTFAMVGSNLSNAVRKVRDLNLKELQEGVLALKMRYASGVDETKVRGFEFGLNVDVRKHGYHTAMQFINSCRRWEDVGRGRIVPILIGKSKGGASRDPFESYRKDRLGGVRMQRENWELKMYDKGLKEGLHADYWLRVEVKVKRMKWVQNLGADVVTLRDFCKKENVQALVKILKDIVRQQLIVRRISWVERERLTKKSKELERAFAWMDKMDAMVGYEGNEGVRKLSCYEKKKLRETAERIRSLTGDRMKEDLLSMIEGCAERLGYGDVSSLDKVKGVPVLTFEGIAQSFISLVRVQWNGLQTLVRGNADISKLKRGGLKGYNIDFPTPIVEDDDTT